jgi:tight adherence protein C
MSLAALTFPLAGAGLVLLVAALVLTPSQPTLQARLEEYGYSLERRNLSQPFGQRVLLPLVSWLLSRLQAISPQRSSQALRLKLIQAGRPAGLDVGGLTVIRLALAALLPMATVGSSLLHGNFTTLNLGIAAFGVFAGWRLPMVWLSFKVDSRKSAIERSLPDALDLLVVCVEAGNGLEQGLATVAQHLHGPLSDEIAATLREVALGKPRSDALRELSQRSGTRDLQTFIAAVLQADRLGIGIAQTLRIQSEAMRTRRRQRAEEQAAKAPVKMLLPLVLFIFPSLMIVIIGPAAMSIFSFLPHLKMGG